MRLRPGVGELTALPQTRPLAGFKREEGEGRGREMEERGNEGREGEGS